MVLIMFAFAFAMIGLMYLYWELHTRPFRPLQMAIGARHPNSMPRVIGGPYKTKETGSRPTLRMVIVVDFDPTSGLPRPADSSDNDEDRVTLKDTMTVSPRIDQMYGSLLHLAQQTTDISNFQQIEIFLEHRRPEQTSRTLFASRSKAEWYEKYPTDPLATPAQAPVVPPTGP